MEINLQTLVTYCEKNGCQIHCAIDIDSEYNQFTMLLGKDPNGGRKEELENKDVKAILELNNIIGENSQVKNILNEMPRDADERIEQLIYGTLSKYIASLFNASIKGDILFKDIKYLEKHMKSHFANAMLAK